ncbi:hypothetical protein [Pectobacterium sp. A5351]|uniref:hypothetical protein n=1 Tax=Pectobacterium sp. A5351 TaxID=2914983 RepID=UPI00232F99F4|nr:hypothetical protein [Pectobacterium sp. A5351]WCG83014.1 hypothetical protein O1Q74_19470 [Pectobacterium sp. A5351]
MLRSGKLDVRLNKPASDVESRSGITYRHHADNHASQAEFDVATLDDALARVVIPPASIALLLFVSAIPIQAILKR